MHSFKNLLNSAGSWQIIQHSSGAIFNFIIILILNNNVGPSFTAHWVFILALGLLIGALINSAVDPVINSYLKRFPKSQGKWITVGHYYKIIGSFLIATLCFVVSLILDPIKLELPGNLSSSWIYGIGFLMQALINCNINHVLLTSAGGAHLSRYAKVQIIINFISLLLKIIIYSSINEPELLIKVVLIYILIEALVNTSWVTIAALNLMKKIKFNHSPLNAHQFKKRFSMTYKRSWSFSKGAIYFFILNKSEILILPYFVEPIISAAYMLGLKVLDTHKQLISIINLRLYQRFCQYSTESTEFKKQYSLSKKYQWFGVIGLFIFTLIFIGPLFFILNLKESIPFILIGFIAFTIQSKIRLDYLKLSLERNSNKILILFGSPLILWLSFLSLSYYTVEISSYMNPLLFSNAYAACNLIGYGIFIKYNTLRLNQTLISGKF